MTTTQQAATRAAIVAAVKAFADNVEKRAQRYFQDGWVSAEDACSEAMRDELAALERTVAADGETTNE